MDQAPAHRFVRIALPIGFLLSLIGFSGYGLVTQTSILLSRDESTATSTKPIAIEIPREEPEPVDQGPIRVALPKEVRGIYWTAETAGNAKRREELTNYMIDRDLNAVVIDVKMDNGSLGFLPIDKTLKPYAMKSPRIESLRALMDELGEKNIYRIARIAVMRDSTFASVNPDAAVHQSGGGLWRDKTGAAWLDPGAPEVADYAIALGREALATGFDELQYDYARFPSDGVLSVIRYPVSQDADKGDVMRAFFDKVGILHAEGSAISFDLFGMTFWSSSHFGIGQRLEDAYPNADFVSPMVYPSHYPTGFRGFENPALHPYEIVKQSLDKGAEMLEADHFISPTSSRMKFRPWLQDFDIGAVYTAAHIEAQIKAARDAGASGWILWNARNVYEPAKYD
jgi:hypothetical protein